MQPATVIALVALGINVVVTIAGALWFVMKITNVTTKLQTSIEHMERTTNDIRTSQQTHDSRIGAIEQRIAVIDERIQAIKAQAS